MAKAKSAKSASASTGPSGRPVWRILRRLLLVALSLAVCGVAFHFVRRTVEKRYLYPTQLPGIVLKDRPAWMTDLLAQQIARSAAPTGISSALDHEVLRNVADSLSRNAWVREVRQVRRVYSSTPGDTIEIDCTFREPRALVSWGFDYYLVDSQGVLLPEKFSPQQLPDIMFTTIDGRRQVNIRVIEGVKSQRPVEPGSRWTGADLAAGLDMAGLLLGRPYVDEIWRINVENHAGRLDNTLAQIRLKTQYNTEIRWGEPRNAAFHVEVDPAQKLQRLAALKDQYGRVDARHPWVDIRFDKVTVPTNPIQSADGSR